MLKAFVSKIMIRLNRKEILLNSEGKPYMVRYIIWGKKNAIEQKYHGRGFYIQKITASDNSQNLYDHPWRWGRLILKGQLEEQTRNKSSEITRSRQVKRFNLVTVHSSRFAHAIRLIDKKPVWMLFWHGRYRNQWGFWVENKKIHWREHFALRSKSTN